MVNVTAPQVSGIRVCTEVFGEAELCAQTHTHRRAFNAVINAVAIHVRIVISIVIHIRQFDVWRQSLIAAVVEGVWAVPVG